MCAFGPRHARALALVLALCGRGDLLAQEPSLASVLARAGDYVTRFQRDLASIVAEETYVQDVRMPIGATATGGTGSPPIVHRELKSDFLLIKPADGDRYVEFRDVFEVDGTSVRDRQERLTRLFLTPSSSSSAQIGRIINESARYNIGNVRRTVNIPTLPLMFLLPDNQRRFRFARVAARTPAMAPPTNRPGDGAAASFTVSTEVWTVEFEERERNTIIRRDIGGDLPARGRFWIEPGSGRVLMSELVVNDPIVRCTIDVSYQSEPLVGFLVPVEMRERYQVTRDGTLITGTATYGRFRRFQVNVDEKIGPIK